MNLEMAEMNRKSLIRHLARGDFYNAEQKIEDNISQINIYIKDLERYCDKVLSKKDKKEFILKGNIIIEDSGKLFEETLLLIKEFKNHKFLNRKDRIKYLTILETFDNRVTRARSKFSEISDKINLQNINVIGIERNSILESRRATINTSGTPKDFISNRDIELFKNRLDEKLLVYEYKEDLDDNIIEERGKQIQLIVKIMGEIKKISDDCINVLIDSRKHVDAISENIVAAHVKTKDAFLEIKEADKINKEIHSSDSFFNMNKVIIFLLIFVVILFFGAISK